MSNGLDIGRCIRHHECSVITLSGVSCRTFDTHTCCDTTENQVGDRETPKMVRESCGKKCAVSIFYDDNVLGLRIQSIYNLVAPSVSRSRLNRLQFGHYFVNDKTTVGIIFTINMSCKYHWDFTVVSVFDERTALVHGFPTHGCIKP